MRQFLCIKRKPIIIDDIFINDEKVKIYFSKILLFLSEKKIAVKIQFSSFLF